MNITYPLFIQARDDKSIVQFDSWNKLRNWYEQIDIEEGLYEGWDINGYPIKLLWDKSLSEPKLELKKENPEIEQLRNALKEYARFYRPKMPFNYSGSSIVDLFKAAQDHVNQGKLTYKLKMKLKSFWK